MLFGRPPEPGTFWNVNLPDPDAPADDVPECVFCGIDPHPLPVAYETRDGKLHYRARYQDRRRETGRDVEQCFAGRITISRVGLHAIPPVIFDAGPPA
jgi:5'-nucleotidase